MLSDGFATLNLDTLSHQTLLGGWGVVASEFKCFGLRSLALRVQDGWLAYLPLVHALELVPGHADGA